MSGFKNRAIWIALEYSYRDRISKDPAAGAKQIRKIVSDCAEMGFNLIFPCVRTHDNTNGYSSKIESNYYGWDLLSVLCEAAKDAGIKIHPWFCFWGDGASKCKQLHGVSWEGNEIELRPDEQVMCPLRPEAQQYMLSLVGEIIDRYPIDGFHLDYIRYPSAPCYCDYHRQQFRRKYGQDPHELEAGSELWEAWNRFNVDGMTDFVGRVSAKVRDAGKEVSAALFPYDRREADNPDRPMTLNNIMPGKEMGKPNESKRYWAIFQNWPDWCRKGYLDYAAVMRYTPDLDKSAYTVEVGPAAAEGANFIMGLGLTSGQTTETLVPQIRLCAARGLTGICFYDYFHLTDWSESDRRKVVEALNA